MFRQIPKSVLETNPFPAVPSRDANAIMALMFQLDISQRLPVAEFKCLQLKQLRALLVHAFISVPHYQVQFRSLGIDQLPDDLDENFLTKLPKLTRQTVLVSEASLHSTATPKAHGKVHELETSGSSGEPVRVLGTTLTSFYWHALGMRDHIWHERDFSGRLAAIRRGPRNTGMAPDGDTAKGWGSITDIVFKSGAAYRLNVATPLAEQVVWMQKRSAEYLLCFPSNVMALADYSIEKGLQFPDLKQVRTIGETVTRALRERVREAWGVAVTDIYSCEEAGYIAIQCPDHDHYHVQSENVLVEIVNEEGDACGIGECGRVLLTTLQNFAMPLIRYELGDMAEWGEPCDCGRTLPVIKKIYGRTRSRMILPDGRSEFPYTGEDGQAFRITGQKPRQLQYIQKSLETIELKLVIDTPLTLEIEARYAKIIQDNLGHPFDIIFSYPDHIPKQANGKFELFICEIQNSSAS